MDTDQILSISSIVIVCTSCIGCVFYAFYISKKRELEPNGLNIDLIEKENGGESNL